MGRIYTAQFSGVALFAAQDLFQITAGGLGGRVVRVHGWSVAVIGSPDEASFSVRLVSVRGVNAGDGSGGTTATPQPISNGDSAFAGTVEMNNTTRISIGAGTLETLEQHGAGFDVRHPQTFFYPPEDQPQIGAPAGAGSTDFWTLAALYSGLGPSVTICGTLWFEDMGLA